MKLNEFLQLFILKKRECIFQFVWHILHCMPMQRAASPACSQVTQKPFLLNWCLCVPLLVSSVFCQVAVFLSWQVIHHNHVHTSRSPHHPPHYCKHCKQREREREKHDVLKSHIQMSLFIFSTLFFFIVFLRQRRWLVRLPLPADNRARVSSWANNLPSLSNFHGCGHWGKQGEVMTAVWFHTVLMS